MPASFPNSRTTIQRPNTCPEISIFAGITQPPVNACRHSCHSSIIARSAISDNTTLDSGSGGDVIATDDISSVKYQRVKITLGADGVNDGDVASGNPLPISHAALTELAAAIDTEVQVDVVGALPAGTNNIGDVDIASIAAGDNNIGNVDVVTLPAVTIAAAQTLATVTTVGTITNPVAVTQSGTWDEVGIHDSGNSITVDAPVGTPVFVQLSDGASPIATLPVSLASVPSHAVTNAGTFAVQSASAGDTAHDAADSGNPVKVGAKATTALSGLTLVANADRTDVYAGVDGVQIIRQDCNLEDIVTATPVAITDGSSTSVISAQGSGVKFYLTEITIANSSSSNVTVDLRDGTAGSVKWTFPVPANGGVVKTFKVPLPFSANTAMAADPSAAASTITVSALGFKSKV